MKDCEKILNEMYWRMEVMVEEKGDDSDKVWEVYGYGVWTSTTSGPGVQTGQLSCTLNIPETASATVALFNIRTTFYVLFATRNK